MNFVIITPPFQPLCVCVLPACRPLQWLPVCLIAGVSAGRATAPRVQVQLAVQPGVRPRVRQRRQDVQQRVCHACGGVQETQGDPQDLARGMQLR